MQSNEEKIAENSSTASPQVNLVPDIMQSNEEKITENSSTASPQVNLGQSPTSCDSDLDFEEYDLMKLDDTEKKKEASEAEKASGPEEDTKYLPAENKNSYQISTEFNWNDEGIWPEEALLQRDKDYVKDEEKERNAQPVKSHDKLFGEMIKPYQERPMTLKAKVDLDQERLKKKYPLSNIKAPEKSKIICPNCLPIVGRHYKHNESACPYLEDIMQQRNMFPPSTPEGRDFLGPYLDIDLI